MDYETKIAEATKLAIARGSKVLQIHYLESDEKQHVRKLL